MPSCAVSTCKNNTGYKISRVTNVKPSLHTFPKDPILAKRWLNACKRSDHSSLDLKIARVCSDHFLETDYERDLKAELLNLTTRKKLKKDAVPSLYLPKHAIDKRDASNSPQQIVEVQLSTKRNVSRQKRIEKRDRKKLVESLINGPTIPKKSADKQEDDLAHCISVKNRCIFCLDNRDHFLVHREMKSWMKSNQVQDFADIWPHIQTNWNDKIIPGYAFLNWGNGPSKLPTMCSSCQDQVLKVAEHSQKISALKLELQQLENEAKRLGVELQKKTMDSPETPLNMRIYASRYRTLLVALVKEKVSEKVMSNTIVFLNQLRGCAVDLSEDNLSIAPVPQDVTVTRIQTTSFPRPTANIRPSENSLQVNDQLMSGCTVDLSRDNLLLVPPTIQQGNPLIPPVLGRTINVNIVTSNAALSENENNGDDDTDTVKVELDVAHDENEEESDHFMNFDSCDTPSTEEEKPDLVVSNNDDAMETTQSPLKEHSPPIHCNSISCPHPKTFVTEMGLKSHNIKFHGGEPFRCRHCLQTFSWFHDVQNHEKIHDRDESVKLNNVSSQVEHSTTDPCVPPSPVGTAIEKPHSSNLTRRAEEKDYQSRPKTTAKEKIHLRSKSKPVHKKMDKERSAVLEHCLTEMKKAVETVNVNVVNTEEQRLHDEGNIVSEKIPLPKRDDKTGRYKCPSCEKSFKSLDGRKLHLRHHHLGLAGKYICDVCGKQFAQSGSPNMHKRIHTGERPFQCHICGQRFRTRCTLQKHLMSELVHKDMEKADENDFVKSDNNLKEPHQCQICGKGFRYYYTLKKHKFRHHQGGKGKRIPGRPRLKRDETTGRFKCSSCEEFFKTSSTLSVHVKYRHLGVKGHCICDVCGAQFRKNFDLVEHKRIHTGERLYQCHICGYKFRFKSNLWKHLSKMHKEKVKAIETSSTLSGDK